MKKIFVLLSLMISATALADVTFEGQPALNVYSSLVGPKVVADGAMGSTYLTGEHITCRGPNDPEAGKDPANYSCTIRFTSNGKMLTPR